MSWTETPVVTLPIDAALSEAGLAPSEAAALGAALRQLDPELSPEACWQLLTRQGVLNPGQPFSAHELIFESLRGSWKKEQGPFPAWAPSDEEIARSNLGRLMQEQGKSYEELHSWSVSQPEAFWRWALQALRIRLRRPWEQLLDLSQGVEAPRWLLGARLNLAASCLDSDDEVAALVYDDGSGELTHVSYAELKRRTARVANALVTRGLVPGEAVAIDMPMTAEAVVIYLGIVRAGGVVVSVADSFSAPEIATRLRIGEARLVFTQDVIRRAGKELPLYAKVCQAEAPATVVLSGGGRPTELREGDCSWEDFLAGEPTTFRDVERGPEDYLNILFSSGTTGEPKAIPWTHTTPLKCAVDGFLHQDIRAGDVVAWPTNLGWMMGPWLIFASLINRATIALYYGAPHEPGFCRFVEGAGVTMLGVVPSLVKAWRRQGSVDGCDWSCVRAFSSTGECSNPSDMLYLMSRAGYRPVIEYCGGTEIGGGYLTATVVKPCAPGTFSTPALGLSFELRDESGAAASVGEVFLRGPSLGLSLALLNRDHHEVYFAGAPTAGDGTPLRRHGDEVESLPNGYYRAHGRVDDTMNLGGIKVSSAAIERVLNREPGVNQTAAIAVPPAGGGPSRLVVYVEPSPSMEVEQLRQLFQARIRAELNPLFKVTEVVTLDRLPRTASNKVMRRQLRAAYRSRGSHA